MRYSEAIDYLNAFTNYEKTPGLASDIDFDGLERVRLLMRLLGRPQNSFSSIVVAGTKGKGSVAAMLESVLREAGHNTGLYTSPHLHTFRERIKVRGEMIPPDTLVRLVEMLVPIVERIQGLQDPTLVPTTYELATAIAFLYFQEKEVGIAVLEVGLGGRLDAVNITTPLVSVITSISLDHMQVLGDTIEQIAYQKAGIIKPGGTVVTAPQAPEAMSVINQVVADQRAKLTVVGKQVYLGTDQLPEIVFDDDGLPAYQAFTIRFGIEAGKPAARLRVTLPLLGSHQQLNATVALATILKLHEMDVDFDRDALLRGFSKVEWPGRLEIVSRDPTVVVDGAHNVASFERLHEATTDLFYRQPVVLVLGFSYDKDIDDILTDVGNWPGSILFGPQIERLIVTQSDHPRAADAQEVAEIARSKGLKVEVREDVREALVRAEILADLAGRGQEHKTIVLVSGSLFLVAEARELYGRAPDLSEEEDAQD